MLVSHHTPDCPNSHMFCHLQQTRSRKTSSVNFIATVSVWCAAAGSPKHQQQEFLE